MTIAAAHVHVLVVDDDYDIRETLAEVLRDAGYEVALAEHGGEALEILRRVRPDVILLDLNMPVVNGAQFRAAQQSDPALATIPTIVMTAVDRLKDAVAGLAPQDVLAKPFKVPDLLAKIGRFAVVA